MTFITKRVVRKKGKDKNEDEDEGRLHLINIENDEGVISETRISVHVLCPPTVML